VFGKSFAANIKTQQERLSLINGAPSPNEPRISDQPEPIETVTSRSGKVLNVLGSRGVHALGSEIFMMFGKIIQHYENYGSSYYKLFNNIYCS